MDTYEEDTQKQAATVTGIKGKRGLPSHGARDEGEGEEQEKIEERRGEQRGEEATRQDGQTGTEGGRQTGAGRRGEERR